ncbi:hypothetical protein V8C86DRAFT_2463543 [Haematococcus lacustris]
MSTEPPNKSARTLCYAARDAFYACVREQAGYDFVPETPVPTKCRALRAAYERGCLPSWVQHFDLQQETAARRAKQLHASIGAKAASAAGALSGKAQN